MIICSYTNGTEYTKPGACPRAGNKPGLGMVRPCARAVLLRRTLRL